MGRGSQRRGEGRAHSGKLQPRRCARPAGMQHVPTYIRPVACCEDGWIAGGVLVREQHTRLLSTLVRVLVLVLVLCL